MTGGAILASTHQSHLDPIVVRTPLARALGFVARKTLFRNPVFGAMISGLGAVQLDRDATTPAGLREVVELLKAGNGLVFFPEGTRSSDGEIAPLRPGVALLAKRSGVPVVPIAVEGTFRCWPRTRRLPRTGRIRVVYGEPVTYPGDADRAGILGDLAARLRVLQEKARRMC